LDEVLETEAADAASTLDAPGAWGLAVPGGTATALVLMLLLLALVVLDLRTLRALPSLRRAILSGLRVLSALVVLLVTVQPTVRTDHLEEDDGRLAVLFDVSRSMGVRSGTTNRIETVNELARRWAGTSGEHPPASYVFGSNLRASGLGEPLGASDDDTLLAAALDSVIDADPEIGAVVVVSDGADRGGAAIEAATSLGIRVHTVAIGADDALRDDGIAEASIDRVAFLRRPARVRVVVRRLGAAGGPIPVSLFDGERLVAEQIVEVPRDGTAEASFEVNLERLGRALYSVSIPTPVGDAVPENDRRALLTRVVRDHLRVLHVAGQPSWDQRWLRGFLERDPTMDLISFFILRSTTDMVMADASELALIPFPTDELFNEHLGSFDVVFFQNFEYAPYAMEIYLPRIRDYVQRGGSFAMIGGPLSFSAAGYAETELQGVLPVEVLPRATPASVATTSDRFRPEVASGMERHPLVMLGADPTTSAAMWAGLSPLQGLNVVGRTRTGGSTLLVHPSHRAGSGEPLPVLSFSEPGRGRSLAIMTDTTWRWGITTGGETGDASFYDRFYDRVLRWLARDESLEPVRVTTDREHYGPDARIEVRGRLADARHAPLRGYDATLSVVDEQGHPVGGEIVVRPNEAGDFESALEAPSDDGGYRVRLHAVPNTTAPLGAGEVLAEEPFVIESGGDELADPRALPSRLLELSEATAGTHVGSPGDAPPLAAFDATRVRTLGSSTEHPLASAWALLLLVALLGGEWILRRRWGIR
jgi:uncharacterized membrane protein